jgi:hypothetical protein
MNEDYTDRYHMWIKLSPVSKSTYIYGCEIEVFMVVKIWFEDGGSMVLQNIGIIPQHHMVSQPRRPWFIITGVPMAIAVLRKYEKV